MGFLRNMLQRVEGVLAPWQAIPTEHVDEAFPYADYGAAVHEDEDVYSNKLAQFNTRNDKTIYGTVTYYRELSNKEIEIIGKNKLVKRILDLPGMEATSEGWMTTIEGSSVEEAAKRSKTLMQMQENLSAQYTFRSATSSYRQWGESIIVMGIDDGVNETAMPVDVDNIKNVGWLRVYGRHEFTKGPEDKEPGVNFGYPLFYEIGKTRQIFHWTRVLRFQTDDKESILHGMNAGLRNFFNTHKASEVTAMEFSQIVYKIDNLREMIESGRQKSVQARIRIADMARSILNSLIIDRKHEEVQVMGRSATGLGELIDRSGIYVSALCGIPITRLLGVSPGGFGTGEHEQRNFNKDVTSIQTDKIKPELLRFVRILARSSIVGASEQEAETVHIKFNPLHPPTEEEIAKARKDRAELAVALVQAQIIDPSEARRSLFGENGSDMGFSLIQDHQSSEEDLQALIEEGKALRKAAGV